MCSYSPETPEGITPFDSEKIYVATFPYDDLPVRESMDQPSEHLVHVVDMLIVKTISAKYRCNVKIINLPQTYDDKGYVEGNRGIYGFKYYPVGYRS